MSALMNQGGLRRAVLALLLATIVAATGGCNCGGGAGRPCNDNTECDPGLYCSAMTMACEPIGDADVPDGGGCPDADGDGVDACVDCDDGDPNTYPGAPEVCGDGIDNACGTSPDAMCMGVGTYVAPPPVGSPGATGTQTDPVDTIAEGIAKSMMIEAMGGPADLPVFVAADVAGPGTFPEAISMVEGVSLLGGHESTTWTRDPATNVTVIADQTPNGIVFAAGITAITELSGFTVNGVLGASGATSAIDIQAGASPLVRDNIINGPGTSGGSRAIAINDAAAANAATPRIENNVINLGSAGGGFGGNGSWGILIDATAAEIIGNTVNLLGDDVIVRGINSFRGIPGLRIVGNLVVGATTGSADVAYGIEVGGDGILIEDNEVYMGSCFQQCVGIGLDGIVSADVINNVVFGGTGSPSVALRIAYENPMNLTRDVLVHSNYLNGWGEVGGQRLTIAVELLNFNPMTSIVVGRFTNNILDSGVGDIRYCFYENGATIDPEGVDTNDFVLSPVGTPIMSGLYNDEGASALTTPAAIDALTDTAATASMAMDPMVVSAMPGGDLHLMAGSPCIDAGSSAELPLVDFEGDARPAGAGPDIGPDES